MSPTQQDYLESLNHFARDVRGLLRIILVGVMGLVALSLFVLALVLL